MRGIYKIHNKINDKYYIGESLNIERRWTEHVEMLNTNKHHSYKLQRDWNLFGEDNFIFEVVREIDIQIHDYVAKYYLIILEDEYIKEYNSFESGYNCEYTLEKVLNGKKIITDKSNDKKMIRAVIYKLENGLSLAKEVSPLKKPVKCIDTGIIYKNSTEAGRSYGNKLYLEISKICKKGGGKIKLPNGDFVRFEFCNIDT